MTFFPLQNVGKTRMLSVLFFLSIMASSVPPAHAQPTGHPLYPAGLPVGAVAEGTMLQPLPLQGYFQPVRLTLPEGCAVSFASGDTFSNPLSPTSELVALLVGQIYRFQISGIPYYAGHELYPTIEMIGRLYPPPGKENEFPVEIEITQEDMESALAGKLVTRVIYLENPLTALATQGPEKATLSHDVTAAQNPHKEAATLGRPMVILRMGNRQPDLQNIEPTFLFGSPAWQVIPTITATVSQPDGSQPGQNKSTPSMLPGGKQSNNDVSHEETTGHENPERPALLIRTQSPQEKSTDPFVDPQDTATTHSGSTGDQPKNKSVDATAITAPEKAVPETSGNTPATSTENKPAPVKQQASDSAKEPLKEASSSKAVIPREAFSPRRSEAVVVDPALKTRGKSIPGNPQVSGEYQNPGGFSLRGQLGAWPQDEYLVDGGDDGPRASVRSGWDVRGVEPEDTVAHYDTLDHRTLVEKSNRVHIYSPRFGSVRKVDGLVADIQWQGYATIDQNTRSNSIASRQKAGRVEKDSKAALARTNLVLRSADSKANVGQVDAHKSPMTYLNQEVTHSLSQLLTHRTFSGTELAFLAERKAAAASLGNVDQLKVIVNGQAARAMIGNKTPEAVFIVGEPETSPRLQLFKVASHDTAQRGEIIEFMIRFDNVGSELIGNVTIIDSLTARLEYIPGSAGASVPAEFFVEPNEAGSLSLRWEIKEPLKAGDFGVVRFRCRVQ